MQSSKSTYTTNLERVQIINLHNAERAKQRFTGKVTVDWKEGEPINEEVVVKKPVRR